MTLPHGHPPFAKPAAGFPADALPFGRKMCNHLAATLMASGETAHDAILELAMRDMAKICEHADLPIADGIVMRIFRDIVGPAPLAIRFGARTFLDRYGIHETSYANGTLQVRCDVPESVLGRLVGRHVPDVVELPARFPGSRARIVRATSNGYGLLVLGIEHRKTQITYADLATPLPIAA
jgi:hypothetical protein